MPTLNRIALVVAVLATVHAAVDRQAVHAAGETPISVTLVPTKPESTEGHRRTA